MPLLFFDFYEILEQFSQKVNLQKEIAHLQFSPSGRIAN